MTIHYSSGNEHNPVDPVGRFELTVEPDGRARLEHFFRAGDGVFDGAVDAADLTRLRQALERAGFPHVEREPYIVPDSRICTLTVGEQHIMAPRATPAYDEAFAILDSLVAQLRD